MEIKYLGSAEFEISSEKVRTILNGRTLQIGDKKIELPGEFEVSGVLAAGGANEENGVIFKTFCENLHLAHLGDLAKNPSTEILEFLGENIDIVFGVLGAEGSEKSAKNWIEKVEPRLAILGGETANLAAAATELGAEKKSETSMKISKSSLSADKTQVVILEPAG